MARSLDTSLLVRVCTNDILDQASQVTNLIESGAELLIADEAIIELTFVLERAYQLPRPMICKRIEALMSYPNIVCSRDIFETVLRHYHEHQALSFTDCYLTAHAVADKASTLLTFDKKLAAQLQHAELLASKPD